MSRWRRIYHLRNRLNTYTHVEKFGPKKMSSDCYDIKLLCSLMNRNDRDLTWRELKVKNPWIGINQARYLNTLYFYDKLCSRVKPHFKCPISCLKSCSTGYIFPRLTERWLDTTDAEIFDLRGHEISWPDESPPPVAPPDALKLQLYRCQQIILLPGGPKQVSVQLTLGSSKVGNMCLESVDRPSVWRNNYCPHPKKITRNILASPRNLINGNMRKLATHCITS